MSRQSKVSRNRPSKKNKRAINRRNKSYKRRIRRNRFLFLLIIILLILFIGFIIKKLPNKPENLTANNIYEKNGNLTTEAKVKDFNYLYDEIIDNYPYTSILNKYTSINIKNIKDKFESQISKTKDDEEYYEALRSILNSFKVSNLKLLDKNDYVLQTEFIKNNPDFPSSNIINDEETKDRYSNMKDSDTIEPLSELSMDMPIEKTACLRLPHFTDENKINDKNTIQEFLNKISDYSFLILDIRGNSGDSIDYFIECLVKPLAKDTLVANSYILEKNNEYIDYLNYYTKYDYFNLEKDDYKLNKLPESMDISESNFSDFSFFKKYSLKIVPEEKSKFSGKIYLLQDEKTSNASDAFSQFSNKTGFATTVGKTTKGGGVNINPVLYQLPNSKLLISMPNGLGLNENGSTNEDYGTYPEIKLDGNKNPLKVLLKILQ